MADQESLVQSLDKPNQISVGLVETPENRIISYLLDPAKLTEFVCANEPDPDYLPLVGLRTRRLGEQYPYPFIQGYRSGNEVTVVCYLLKQGQPLPPPARVIAYLQPAQGDPLCLVFGLLKFGVGDYGSIGFNPQPTSVWRADLASQLAYRALSYDDQEVLTGAGLWVQCDQFPAYGAGHVEISPVVSDFDAFDVINWEGPAGTLNSRSSIGPNPTARFQIDISLTPISQNQLRVSHTVTNVSGFNLTNVFCLCYFEFFSDLDTLVQYFGTPSGAWAGINPFFYLTPNAGGINGGRYVGIKTVSSDGLVRAGQWRDSETFGFGHDFVDLKTMSWDVDSDHEQTESYLLFEFASLDTDESKTMVCDIVIGETFEEISA